VFAAVESSQWSRQVHSRNLQVLISDAPSEVILIFVIQSWGKYSTSSPATAPEMLATEVTPGLLAGAEPDAHQFNVTICLKGVIKWKETQKNIISTQKLGQACMDE
jgi:hypothetical protein